MFEVSYAQSSGKAFKEVSAENNGAFGRKKYVTTKNVTVLLCKLPVRMHLLAKQPAIFFVI